MIGSEPWFVSDAGPGARKHAPATVRNRDAIIVVLREMLPKAGTILEIASGSGEHVVHFAEAFPALAWQPSDPEPEARRSIAAWTAASGLANIAPPLDLDAADDWPLDRADAILCINMVHISPWAATVGLMHGAGRILPPGATLYLYGPYRRTDAPTAESNEAFDVSLKSRDPGWGLRYVDEMIALAAAHGLGFERLLEMPANNLSLIFVKGR